MAGLFSAIALPITLIRDSSSWRERGAHFLSAVAVYTFGGVAAGAVVGLLRPLARNAVGAMLIGIPASAGIFGGILVLGDGVPRHWQKATWVDFATMCGLFGPFFAFLLWRVAMRAAKKED